jgi:hypothetical protein
VGGVHHPQHSACPMLAKEQYILLDIYCNILTMHEPITVNSNNISKWHMGLNSMFKGLKGLQGEADHFTETLTSLILQDKKKS